MKVLEKIKRALIFPLIGIIFATSALVNPTPVYADPVTEETTTETTTTPADTTTETPADTKDEKDGDNSVENATCYSQVGGLGWLLCPVMAFLSKGIDTIYSVIEDFLVVEPISMEEDSPVFTIWLYIRNLTNIVFVIFFLFIIYSQITGFGISNYGIKKALPKLIIAAILVNLSYVISMIAVDASNIVGHSLHDYLSNIAETALSNGAVSADVSVSFYDVFTTIAAGGVIGFLAVGLAGGPLGLLLALIPVIFGGIISVAIGLITISLRQAVIILLVSIAPLAFVAYLLPNTERWFKKWVDTFSQMLFFYPMFSLLFGASKLASWIFISGANSMLGIILGLAVQVFPLILALSLMKMAGSVLGGISGMFGKLGDKANNGIKNFVEPYKATHRAQQLAKGMRQPFDPLSAASWRAASHKRKANIKFRQEQAEKTVAGLTNENLNSLRRNQRIIGYDKNNQPIYTQLPVRRTNKYMDAEAEAREVDLRAQADEMKTENAYGELSSYQRERGMRHGRAIQNASRMGNHYLSLRTQMDAKAANERADERFYNETVMKAAERDINTGELKSEALYNKYINGALGADGYKVNQTTAEGRRLAEQAAVNVIGDAYSRSEAQRAANIKRFEAYMDKQVTKEVVRQYEDMIKYDNIDGIIAAHNILAMRGDYDKISKHMTEYMNSGKIKLTEDAANRLAMNFLSMKDKAPDLARLGKFMNVETWAYTSGKRHTQEITMEQYLTGIINNDRDTNYKIKVNIASGLEGTKLTGIDRTFYDSLDNILSQITEDKYTVKTAVALREKIEDSITPQQISALPTFASGSEQIHSMVGHMFGVKWDSAKGAYVDNINIDEKTAYQKEIDRQMADYVIDKYSHGLTPRDLINMKTDTWLGLKARLMLNTGRDLNDAEQKRLAEAEVRKQLREKLFKNQLDKLSDSNMNIDTMKLSVRKDLGL